MVFSTITSCIKQLQQSRPVSIVTVAFTAAHFVALVIIALWFSVRLKWNTTYFQRIRRSILWYILLHTQPFNINTLFRIFLRDNQVFDVSYKIARMDISEHPSEPNTIIKYLRSIVIFLMNIYTKLRQVLRPIGRTLRIILPLFRLLRWIAQPAIWLMRQARLGIHCSSRNSRIPRWGMRHQEDEPPRETVTVNGLLIDYGTLNGLLNGIFAVVLKT